MIIESSSKLARAAHERIEHRRLQAEAAEAAKSVLFGMRARQLGQVSCLPRTMWQG